MRRNVIIRALVSLLALVLTSASCATTSSGRPQPSCGVVEAYGKAVFVEPMAQDWADSGPYLLYPAVVAGYRMIMLAMTPLGLPFFIADERVCDV